MSLVALVVDDSMLIRHTVCRYLEERGFEVESATDGHEALEVLSRIRPNIIITDLQMPKMSGAELIAALKDKLETVSIPIVILTSRQRRSVTGEHGANFAIYKDIDIETQLEKVLKQILGNRAVKQHASGKTS